MDHARDQAWSTGQSTMSIGIISDHTELRCWYAKIGFIEGETKAFNHLPFKVTLMEYIL